MARYLYSELAKLVQARKNCLAEFQRTGVDNGWFDQHSHRIEELVSEHLPSGGGFDSGTQIDLDSSHSEKLVLTTGFHHMHENGMYDGWTRHKIVVTPSFVGGFKMRVNGPNRNDIKDYIGDTFHEALGMELSDVVSRTAL